MNAKELLSANETGIVVCTDGHLFNLYDDGTGASGNLVVKKKPGVDKVIVYKQDKRRNRHDVYVGMFDGVRPSDEEGRRMIRMTRVRFVGTTDSNWNEFADLKSGGRNPVRYVP